MTTKYGSKNEYESCLGQKMNERKTRHACVIVIHSSVLGSNVCHMNPMIHHPQKIFLPSEKSQLVVMSRSSWIVPFAMGASTALSLVWLSRRLNKTAAISSTANHTKISRSAPATSSADEPKQIVIAEKSETDGELMDSMELDHRLLRKAEAVLQWRTTRLVLVVERCTNDHNYSAILRTAEALGIQIVYMIDPPEVVDEVVPEDLLTQQQRRQIAVATPEEIEARRQHHLFARKATEWLTVKDFATSQDCVNELRRLGYQLWVTDLSQEAECLTLTSPQVPDKVALVMGTEAVGCSQYMLEQADKRVYLPLRGFADSLNLSVATALIVHQLFVMDPSLIGATTQEEKLQLREAWFSKLCQQRILTPSQRKQRQKLKSLLQKCQVIYERSQQPQARKLQPSEQKKLDEWDSYKQQLEELEALVDPAKVQAAVQEWVQNPPMPLTDVRRADEHRVCYVGKNTKALHEDDWKDMVATTNAPSLHLSSAAAFREKVMQVQS